MKTNVQFCDFQDAFVAHDGQDTFTYEGKRALYDYLIRYEEDCDTEVELDVIALCCEYTEYENLAELQDNYTDIHSMANLTENTTIIYIDNPPDNDDDTEYDDRFIIQDY